MYDYDDDNVDDKNDEDDDNDDHKIQCSTHQSEWTLPDMMILKFVVTRSDNNWKAAILILFFSLSTFMSPVPTLVRDSPTVVAGAEGCLQNMDNEKKRIRRRKSRITYKPNLWRFLEGIDPSLQLSRKAADVMDSFMLDMLERLAKEAASLARIRKKSTISASGIQTATRLVLPGELAKHAVSEGTKSVMKFRDACVCASVVEFLVISRQKHDLSHQHPSSDYGKKIKLVNCSASAFNPFVIVVIPVYNYKDQPSPA